MLAKRIIPCLDITGGRVVNGVNFVELRDAVIDNKTLIERIWNEHFA